MLRAAFLCFCAFILVGLVTAGILSVLIVGESPEAPAWVTWWYVFAVAAPPYVLFAAPAITLFIRQAISRQREFLADADAVLLTRDPEGLALALTKVGAWIGPPLKVSPAVAHLYITDPLGGDAAWWDRIFPCHPTIQARIDLLERMGVGVSATALEAARNLGLASAEREAVNQLTSPSKHDSEATLLNGADDDEPSRKSVPQDASDLEQRLSGADDDESSCAAAAACSVVTPLYEKPEGWSKILRELPHGTPLTFGAIEGGFVQVTTGDNVVGYIPVPARARE